MLRKTWHVTLFVLVPLVLVVAPVQAVNRADVEASLKLGRPDLESIGPLAFGPEGILFAGDSLRAAIYALDTGEGTGTRPATSHAPLNVQAVNEKIAALAGTSPEQIRIHDLAVNPTSGRAYLSVTRGQGPDAIPLIFRVDAKGQIEVLSLEAIKFAKAALPNPPDPDATRRGRSLRQESITDLAYVDDTLLATGLSNEEFSSRLRTIPFPFAEVDAGTSVEIFHGSHGRSETYAPVRTFVRYDIQQEPYVLAAYTCTPLVKLPVSEMKPGVHLVGTTVAELGNRNRPLDMIIYRKGGKDWLLVANNRRGVMKLDLAQIDSIEGISERIAGTAGLPYETVAELQGVRQLDMLDQGQALLLVEAETGTLDLQTVPLP